MDMVSLFNLYGYLPQVLRGAVLTLEIALLSLLVAVIIGMMAALAKRSDSRALQGIAFAYTTIIRGIPDLILMLLIFYGAPLVINNMLASMNAGVFLDISPFGAGVVTIGLIMGAYMGETFRGAMEAVEPGQMMAAKAYGMGPVQSFIRILLPQMMRHALPGFSNNWLVLLKTTALVSLIGLEDMVRVASIAGGATHKYLTFYLAISVIFLLFTSLSLMVLKHLEKRYALVERAPS